MSEIVILSGKGGTGKTSLSAAFATLGEELIVADCDVDTANLHLVLKPSDDFHTEFITGSTAKINSDICISCGLCVESCRFEAIQFQNGKISVSAVFCDGCKLCYRICPVKAIEMVDNKKSYWSSGMFRNGFMVHARLAPGEENSGKLVGAVREQARKIAQMTGLKTTIIDGPPGIGCPVISSLTGTQSAIIVCEPSRSGFHDLIRIVELVRHYKIAIYIVINKFDLNENLTTEISSWCKDQLLPVVGHIPFDWEIVEAMAHCKSITEWDPDSPAAREVRSIYSKVFVNGLL